jgi:hypothetical protein
MGMSKAERNALILRNLRNAPTPDSGDEAIALIRRVVTEVEDKHSGVPAEPYPPMRYQGRMYPPEEDNIQMVSAGRLARTKGNYIYIWHDGGFDILDLRGYVLAFNHHAHGI